MGKKKTTKKRTSHQGAAESQGATESEGDAERVRDPVDGSEAQERLSWRDAILNVIDLRRGAAVFGYQETSATSVVAWLSSRGLGSWFFSAGTGATNATSERQPDRESPNLVRKEPGRLELRQHFRSMYGNCDQVCQHSVLAKDVLI